jgi:hypothetical protein
MGFPSTNCELLETYLDEFAYLAGLFFGVYFLGILDLP